MFFWGDIGRTPIKYKRYSVNVLKAVCALLNGDGGIIEIYFDVQRERQYEKWQKIQQDIQDKFYNFANYIKFERFSETIQIHVNKTNGEIVYLDNIPYVFRGKKLIGIQDCPVEYLKMVFHHGFPIITRYTPTFIAAKASFTTSIVSKHVSFRTIGEQDSYYLYKYMDLESALQSLEGSSLRLVEPTFWDDQYEGKYYNADYTNVPNGVNNSPFLYACCFSSKSENEAAWVLYPHNRKGLASRCVKFTVNKHKLYQEIVDKSEPNVDWYAGSVQYKYKSYIDELAVNNTTSDYYKYFKPFSKEKYLNLLLLKRPAYEHEQEVRIFSVPLNSSQEKSVRSKRGKLKKKSDPLYTKIDWINIIEKVEIDDSCSDYEKSLLNKLLSKLVEDKKNTMKWSGTSKEYKSILKKTKLIPTNVYKDETLKKGHIVIDKP